MKQTVASRWQTWIVMAALTGITLAAYWPVTGFSFLAWDDNTHVYKNPYVRTGLTWANFVWSFGIHGPSQWHPLTWWSHQLDCHIFGAEPEAAGWHHAMNLAFHVGAALVLLTALRRLTEAFWPSAFVAAVFALHPLNVESVAWVSQRRDVLSALFWGLTLWAYASYAQRGGWRRYALVVVCFALGLMAKPMLVTLPCVLLLLDYWPLRRINGPALVAGAEEPDAAPRCPQRSAGWLLVEKLPLFLLAGASAFLSYWCQARIGAIRSLEMYPLSSRVANAFLSYVLYLRNMLWPASLRPFYPLPPTFAAWQVAAAAALLLAITAAALWQARRRPWLLVGWLWYLGTLVPVIGLLRMGAEVAMADRWVYLPLVGTYLAVAWGVRDLSRRSRGRQVAVAVLALIVLAACALLTHRQTRCWENDETFGKRLISVAPDSSSH